MKKKEYIEFCQNNKEMPIFFQPWWLNAASGTEGWDFISYKRNDTTVAVLPFQKYKKKGFQFIVNPVLTNRMGIYISYPQGQSYYKRLSYEQEVTNGILANLPSFDFFMQSFHYEFKNWLPLFWNGYRQTTRYSYIVNTKNRTNEELIASFSSEAKKKIRKAEKSVKVVEDRSFDEFYDICLDSYLRQKKKITFTKEVLSCVVTECQKNSSGKIFFAVDEEKRIHAALFVVWDTKFVYLIASGGSTELRKSGAMNLLIKEALLLAKEKNLNLDFEGSMMEAIERYNRQFGTRQQEYHEISKINSKLLKSLFFLKEIKRSMFSD